MTCGFCAQARQVVSRVWRRARGRACIVKGCNSPADHMICLAHWRAMPLELRQRWWRESNYSRERPPQGLVDEVNAAVQNLP